MADREKTNTFVGIKHIKNTYMVNEGNNKCILVAEDVDSNYMLVKAFIGKIYTLVRANNGVEAVEQFKECNPDLILMDIKMPEMDGLEATRVIRGISKEVPIIALTAYAFASDKEAALEAGCTDFLTKPIVKNDLLSAIEELLNK